MWLLSFVFHVFWHFTWSNIDSINTGNDQSLLTLGDKKYILASRRTHAPNIVLFSRDFLFFTNTHENMNFITRLDRSWACSKLLSSCFVHYIYTSDSNLNMNNVFGGFFINKTPVQVFKTQGAICDYVSVSVYDYLLWMTIKPTPFFESKITMKKVKWLLPKFFLKKIRRRYEAYHLSIKLPYFFTIFKLHGIYLKGSELLCSLRGGNIDGNVRTSSKNNVTLNNKKPISKLFSVQWGIWFLFTILRARLNPVISQTLTNKRLDSIRLVGVYCRYRLIDLSITPTLSIMINRRNWHWPKARYYETTLWYVVTFTNMEQLNFNIRKT